MFMYCCKPRRHIILNHRAGNLSYSLNSVRCFIFYIQQYFLLSNLEMVISDEEIWILAFAHNVRALLLLIRCHD